ncbi:histidine kinase [Bacillus coahuilensis p1.1.43]|uniref:histidine kinase n=2 Tax=Bacillus coahuilensis TaxID=408580 RepID=A0A147KBK7_9BACI|nr:histidine kinase [Bacillus coahuilensis p1.1.43]
MMMVSSQLQDYLVQNAETFIQNWRNRVMISEDDPYKEEVLHNACQMYVLVNQALLHPLNEEEIKHLAFKLASERIEANVNISEFVFNVNIGRSEILHWVSKSGIKWEELQKVIQIINDLFDRFSYWAVRRYTEIKENFLREKQLFINQTHKERLTILGQMSSSFVHEFRNPLTSVIGFTTLLQQEYPDHPYLTIIQHELNQLNYRVTQFLLTSKKEVLNSKVEEISVDQLFKELIDFIFPSLLANDVEIIQSINSEMSIKTRIDEIRQIVINLLMNSIDALQEIDGKRQIEVKAKSLGEFIEITISNNGPMIDEDTIQAIFEPFYTTKELGTGIGLYICKKIVEKQGGTIQCLSERDVTSFILTIPKDTDNHDKEIM